MRITIQGTTHTVDGLKIRIMPLTSGKCFWYIFPYRNTPTGEQPLAHVSHGRAANETAAKRAAETAYWAILDGIEERDDKTKSYEYVPERPSE